MRHQSRTGRLRWTRLKHAIPFFVGPYMISSCGLEESPSFLEDVRSLNVDVQVDRATQNDADAIAGADTADDATIDDILGRLSEFSDDPWSDDLWEGDLRNEDQMSGSSGSYASAHEASLSNGSNSSSDANPAGGAGHGSGANGSDEAIVGPVSSKELALCAKLTGVDAKQIHVMGNQTSKSITANSVIAARVTGNRSNLNLNLQGGEETYVRGLCLFVAGNQGSAKVNVGLHLGQLLYVGRGNRSRGEVYVAANGKIDQVVANLSGNATTLQVAGPGNYYCAASRVSGNSGGVSCD